MYWQFQSHRLQHVMPDGCRSKLVNAVTGVPHGNVWALYCSYCIPRSFFTLWRISWSDDSTLLSVVPSPGVRVSVAESLNRDLGKVSEWCDLWKMKFNASKIMTMIVSRSRTMQTQTPSLTIFGAKRVDINILWLTFDSKMTFEKHLGVSFVSWLRKSCLVLRI